MFHRLTVPSYAGGLPGGYDYINNALAGTPADADGVLAAGPNAGSYLIGFGEDARSRNANRPIKALAQNCDYLDDLLRRDIAMPTRTTAVTTVGAIASVTITGPGIFLGASGVPSTTAGYGTAFQIVDDNEREIVNGGVECKVTAVSGGTFGVGAFSAGDVALTVSPVIPTATTYRVYYGTRSNLASMPVDAFTNIKIRSAEEVPGEILGTGGAALVGYAAGPDWADSDANPATTVQGQINKIIADLAAGDGPMHIGSDALPAWADSSTIDEGNLGENLGRVVEDLAEDAGSSRVGSGSVAAPFVGAPFTLSAVDVHAQLSAIVGELNQPYRSRVVAAGGDFLNSGGFADSILYFSAAGYAFGLANPALNKNRRVYLIDTADSFSYDTPVTLGPFGGEKINGATGNYPLMVPGGRWVLICDGTDWYTLSA